MPVERKKRTLPGREKPAETALAEKLRWDYIFI
jgi:hypothetical protein